MTREETLLILNPAIGFMLGFILQGVLTKDRYTMLSIYAMIATSFLPLMMLLEAIPFSLLLLGYVCLYGLLGLLAASLYRILKKMLRIYYMSRYK